MNFKLDARRWRFLDPMKASGYIKLCNSEREEGWRVLVPSTTRRQFATAKEILDRMKGGQKGLLLADDVGLGKTTVAALCALVVAGMGGSVRILAPNEVMSRRWRQELEFHIRAVSRFAKPLNLSNALKRLRQDVQRVRGGVIAVTTHQKAGQLQCDLLIVDEAHRTRSDASLFAKSLRRQAKGIGKILILTATPFSLDPNDLAGLLKRASGGKADSGPVRKYARLLDNLWRGQLTGAPEDLSRRITDAAKFAVEEMTPYVIRHHICGLSSWECRTFGEVEINSASANPAVPEMLLEAMLRADRALRLAQESGSWSFQRRNDPRYHVGSGKLESDLKAMLHEQDVCMIAKSHARHALRGIRKLGPHPKIEHTVKIAAGIVGQGEKVLIFCDHHATAAELTQALAQAICWDEPDGNLPPPRTWRDAWIEILKKARGSETKLPGNYAGWLASEGVRIQVSHWLRSQLQPDIPASELEELLKKEKARGNNACDSIAKHAIRLYSQLIDPESRSTRAILRKADPAPLPGVTRHRVVSLCDPPPEHQQNSGGVFLPGEPDALLAVFNSPFGPDVLVATDRLSEGVDLHRFCRHLIHHELDPSPVRTVQRNGRLRRVACWAARTGKPIRIYYPALQGTRDERLVRIMQFRLSKFDLLLGGVRAEVSADEPAAVQDTAEKVLQVASKELGRLWLGVGPRRRSSGGSCRS